MTAVHLLTTDESVVGSPFHGEATMPAAPVDLQPCSRFEWERVLRRTLGLGIKTKGVGLVLASFGDADGTRIRPGFPRLSACCEMGESSCRRHVDKLRSLGMVLRVRNGGGRNRLAAEYRLTIPANMLEVATLLDPDEITPLSTVSGVLTVGAVDDAVGAVVDDRELSSPGERSTVIRFPHTPLIPERTPLILGPNSAHSGERPPRDQPPTPRTREPRSLPHLPDEDRSDALPEVSPPPPGWRPPSRKRSPGAAS